MARRHRGIEALITLGDTCVEHVIVRPGGHLGELRVVEAADGYLLRSPDGSELVLAGGSSLRLPCGLGTIVVSPATRSTVALARAPIDRRACAVVAASLVVHLVVLSLAFHASEPRKPPPRSQGSPRPRLVANHTTSTRALPDPRAVHGANELDQPEQRLDATPGPPIATPAAVPRASSRMTGSKRADASGAAVQPGVDPVRQPATEATRHFDPCANGDCGLIETSRYATTSVGQHAGDDYQLAPRETRPLETAVVACDANGECNTLSGTDERDVRGAIAHHLREIEACFDGHSEATAAVDARVDDHGAVRVWAHDADPVSVCIAAVAGKLTFASGERNVTLAFARDR